MCQIGRTKRRNKSNEIIFLRNAITTKTVTATTTATAISTNPNDPKMKIQQSPQQVGSKLHIESRPIFRDGLVARKTLSKTKTTQHKSLFITEQKSQEAMLIEEDLPQTSVRTIKLPKSNKPNAVETSEPFRWSKLNSKIIITASEQSLRKIENKIDSDQNDNDIKVNTTMMIGRRSVNHRKSKNARWPKSSQSLSKKECKVRKNENLIKLSLPLTILSATVDEENHQKRENDELVAARLIPKRNERKIICKSKIVRSNCAISLLNNPLRSLSKSKSNDQRLNLLLSHPQIAKPRDQLQAMLKEFHRRYGYRNQRLTVAKSVNKRKSIECEIEKTENESNYSNISRQLDKNLKPLSTVQQEQLTTTHHSSRAGKSQSREKENDNRPSLLCVQATNSNAKQGSIFSKSNNNNFDAKNKKTNLTKIALKESSNRQNFNQLKDETESTLSYVYSNESENTSHRQSLTKSAN